MTREEQIKVAFASAHQVALEADSFFPQGDTYIEVFDKVYDHLLEKLNEDNDEHK